jgi:hypothetical protein
MLPNSFAFLPHLPQVPNIVQVEGREINTEEEQWLYEARKKLK